MAKQKIPEHQGSGIFIYVMEYQLHSSVKMIPNVKVGIGFMGTISVLTAITLEGVVKFIIFIHIDGIRLSEDLCCYCAQQLASGGCIYLFHIECFFIYFTITFLPFTIYIPGFMVFRSLVVPILMPLTEYTSSLPTYLVEIPSM